MKKIPVLIVLIFTLLLSGCTQKKIEPFQLTSKYYESSEFIELDKDNLNTLIENKENFAIFIYQPLCEASATFNNVLTEFIDTYKISIYKMAYKNIKETSLKKDIKYYPSLVIYKNGEVIDYLEADKDEDTKSFKNIDDFINWFTKYVIINQDENESNNESNNNNEINNDDTKNDKGNESSNQNNDNSNKTNPIYTTKEEDKTNNTNESNNVEKPKESNIVLENVTYNENKVNIYLFWGDGCPHCEKEQDFFEKIENEYGKYYTLHKYEVWHNDKNEEILEAFANKMGDTISGVPYTIIGNKTFKGFNESYEEDIINAILSQYKNSYDVYFDINN